MDEAIFGEDDAKSRPADANGEIVVLKHSHAEGGIQLPHMGPNGPGYG